MMKLLGEGTLLRAWARRWREDPARPVLYDGGWVTRGELGERTARVASRFAAAGLRPGDRVVVSAQASARLVEGYVGALRLGLVVVPANTAYRERELAHIVEDASPRAAIVDDEQRASWLRDRGVGIVAGPDVDLPDGGPVELDLAAPGDPMLLCYTSGTTGAPKGAVLSHANLLAGAEALRIAWRWTPDDRLVLALPLFHLHGLGVGLHGTLLAGAEPPVLGRRPTATRWAARQVGE